LFSRNSLKILRATTPAPILPRVSSWIGIQGAAIATDENHAT